MSQPFRFQLFEAIVTDPAPDPALPGHILVQIPELFGDLDIPTPIAPMYPGWTAGGWHSTPAAINPDDGGTVRVLVARLAPSTFRWIGTSQEWSWITDAPGERCGARSGDGRHKITLDNTSGAGISVSSVDDTKTTKNYIFVGANGTIQMATDGGAMLLMSSLQVAAISPGGDTLAMDDNGVILMHRDGVAYLALKSGDIANLAGSAVQISGGTIELGGGTIPPIHPYLLTISFFTELMTVMSDIAAGFAGAAPPYISTVIPPFIAQLASSISAGAPFASTRIKGD